MKRPTRPRKHAPGEVTGPAARALLEAGLDYAGMLTDPAQAYIVTGERPWFDGQHYWVPVHLALPGAYVMRALERPGTVIRKRRPVKSP